MAAKKEPTKDVAEAVAEEAKPAAKLPKPLRRRPSKPDGPFVNSSFADRAKASGSNKRVAESDSK